MKKVHKQLSITKRAQKRAKLTNARRKAYKQEKANYLRWLYK